MTNTPKTASVVVCILLLGLGFVTSMLLRVCFADNYQIVFPSDVVFYSAMCFTGFIWFLLGFFYARFNQPWTMDNFIDRVENEHTANHMHFLIMERKIKMGWADNFIIVPKEKKK